LSVASALLTGEESFVVEDWKDLLKELGKIKSIDTASAVQISSGF